MFLDQAKCADELAWKTQITDWEILDCAGRLGPVISIRGHPHLAHGIGLGPIRSFGFKGHGLARPISSRHGFSQLAKIGEDIAKWVAACGVRRQAMASEARRRFLSWSREPTKCVP